MNELKDFDFNEDLFNVEDFDFNDKEEFRINKPKLHKNRKETQIKFHNAKKLAKEMDFSENERFDFLVNGTFIFGDFIEALLVEKNIKAKRMVISTLSMSQENIDSLRILLEKNYIDELNLIVSDYFFSHERNFLIKYAYEQLDIDNKFQLSVSRTHTKICYFETIGGKKIVMHGSANLRSSDNIEQFTLEINDKLFDFYNTFFSEIIETYKTINKSVRNSQINKMFNK